MILVALLLVSALDMQKFATAANKIYDMSDLLKPQQDFEINLVVPNSLYVSPHSLPSALTQSMEYLMANQIPYRLLYNMKGKIRPPSPIRTARHADNRISNLVFVAFHGNTGRLDLFEAVFSCIFTSNLVFSSVVYKDITQLIVEFPGLRETREWVLASTLPHQNLPLHIIMLYWLSSEFARCSVYLIRETCGCDDLPPVIRLEEALLCHPSNDDVGMQNLITRIRAEKRNFRGRKLVIVSSISQPGSWEEDWKERVLNFRLTRAHTGTLWDATAGVLRLFHSVHNLTFNTLYWGTAERNIISGWPQSGIISKRSSINCFTLQDCFLPPLSLDDFRYFSTLSFSTPAQSKSFELGSLAAPFLVDPMASIVLLGLCISVVLLLLKVREEWNLAETTLSVFAAFASQSNGNTITVLERRCKAGWLLLVGFIAVRYTNILQSIVVAPSAHYNDLNIRDMLENNFTIMTSPGMLHLIKHKSNWQQDSFNDGTKADKLKLREIEKELALRMKALRGGALTSWLAVIQHFSEAQKKVLVLDNLMIERLKWIPREVGRDLLVGKERFFSSPLLWLFGDVERGLLLAQSVVLFNQVGFILSLRS